MAIKEQIARSFCRAIDQGSIRPTAATKAAIRRYSTSPSSWQLVTGQSSPAGDRPGARSSRWHAALGKIELAAADVTDAGSISAPARRSIPAGGAPTRAGPKPALAWTSTRVGWPMCSGSSTL